MNQQASTTEVFNDELKKLQLTPEWFRLEVQRRQAEKAAEMMPSAVVLRFLLAWKECCLARPTIPICQAYLGSARWAGSSPIASGQYFNYRGDQDFWLRHGPEYEQAKHLLRAAEFSVSYDTSHACLVVRV